MRPLKIRILNNITKPATNLKWLAYQYSRGNNYILATMPSSGTHWLRFMLANILVDYYHLDHDLTSIKVPNLIPTYRDINQRFKYNNEKAIPRIQHTHSSYNPLFRGQKIILLVRDLRDAINSNYFRYVNAIDPKISFHDYLRGQVRPGYHSTLATRVDFLNKWWNNRHQVRDLLLVRYEDLKSNPIYELKKICDFLDIQPSEELIKRAVLASSLERMKNLENQDKAAVHHELGRKIRRGQVGDYAQTFSPEDLTFFQEYVKENLIYHYGYDYFN